MKTRGAMLHRKWFHTARDCHGQTIQIAFQLFLVVLRGRKSGRLIKFVNCKMHLARARLPGALRRVSLNLHRRPLGVPRPFPRVLSLFLSRSRDAFAATLILRAPPALPREFRKATDKRGKRPTLHARPLFLRAHETRLTLLHLATLTFCGPLAPAVDSARCFFQPLPGLASRGRVK